MTGWKNWYFTFCFFQRSVVYYLRRLYSCVVGLQDSVIAQERVVVVFIYFDIFSFGSFDPWGP